MDGVSKTYPGGKKCFENIRLSFLPGVKIGVVGVNGAGKSTLMRIMAGLDTDFTGEAWAAEGARVGYLPQEPELDESLTCATTSCWASPTRRPSSTGSTNWR
jgi:ATPase subunit of ABC transporter with duplicated ATPase domains